MTKFAELFEIHNISKNMKEEFELIAKTFQGLEEVLAKELIEIGASNVEIGRRMVSFTGDKEMMYKANFYLRTAIRILKPIKHFEAKTADEVYEAVKSIEWEKYLDNSKSFSVDAVVFSNEFRHSKFVAYKVKDAIVDYFRDKTGDRPSVRISNPDLALNIHVAETKCTLSLDSSGDSLHRRGYRQEAVEAPLNEVLAAGMIMMTGWKGECDLIDPMCGSGTIPIEAALIARNIAPGVFRKEFAFEKWTDFDQDMFDAIYNDDSQEREFEHKIFGFDNNPKANEIAQHNVKAAGVSKDIVLRIQPFQQFEQPKEKSIIITNPPYGERISTNDLLGLYKMIGERLKHSFTGNDAWILSYREECFSQIGLKPSRTIPLFNGALECEFRQYQLFDGKYKDFRTENSDETFRKNAEHTVRRESSRKDNFNKRERGDRRDFKRHEDGDKGGFRRREDSEKREFKRRDDSERGGFKRRESSDRGDFKRRDDSERSGFKRRENSDRGDFKRRDDSERGGFKRRESSDRGDFKKRDDSERGGFKRRESSDRGDFKKRDDSERGSFRRSDSERSEERKREISRFAKRKPRFTVKRDDDNKND